MTSGTRWLYATGNPAGIEAQFVGLALTNFSASEAGLDLEARSATDAIASLDLESPQGNGTLPL